MLLVQQVLEVGWEASMQPSPQQGPYHHYPQQHHHQHLQQQEAAPLPADPQSSWRQAG
jgi:hypothetical protein